jgi:cobalamin biosynthetic protein CobC
MTKIQELREGPQNRDLPVYHGGDLAAARRLFPDAPEPWIDLSTGINPLAYPIPPLPSDVFTRLPEAAQLAALEAAAACRYRVPAAAKVIAAPGTQALIQLLPRLYDAKRVGILGFTYGEYRQVFFHAAGCNPVIVEDLEALRACDLALIVNPNNPDGRRVPAEDLAALAAHLAGKNGLLVVDEAFIDLLPRSQSLVPILPEAGALVLRSFGKTYGLPGVRLGFAVTAARLAERLRGMLGPWPVSGPAMAIGQAALADDVWIEALPERLAPRMAIVADAFMQCGAQRVGGTPLFHLFAHANAESLFDRFGRQGVLLRRFPERPHWLRVGAIAEICEDRFAAVTKRILQAG